METSKTNQADGLQEDTDADLLTYMSWRASDPQSARAAGGAFYDRHIRYVYGVCLRAARKYFMDATCAEDLAAETFSRVYERAGTFNNGGITDPVGLRLRVRAWIGAIAKNVVMDALRGRQVAPEQHLDSDAWYEQPAGIPAADSADVALVRRAMEEMLDDREREVIRVTFLAYKPGAIQQRLSNVETAELAQALQTTPDNLRKIRRNAMHKIREYLTAHCTDTNGDHRQMRRESHESK
jgi:RNA polymerase sigma factor (sigma-70 family)